MTDRPLDRWRDRMISALYGELTEGEMREFESALEADDELRSDWQELRQARASLQQLAQEDATPEFRFHMPLTEPVRRPDAKVVPLWRWALASAAGFAAAASIFLALLVSGLRVDRTANGVLVRFEGEPAVRVADASDEVQRFPGGGRDYLTRAEFAALAEVLLDTTTVRLDEFDRRQASSRAEVAQALYDALAVQQQRQYNDLSSQIQLALLRSGGPNPGAFGGPGMNSEYEGNQNDTH